MFAIVTVSLCALTLLAAPAVARKDALQHRHMLCLVSRHRRHCVAVPKGAGGDHHAQNSRRGPRFVDPLPADGRGTSAADSQGAVDWAYAHLGSQEFDGWCAKFVAFAFGAPNFGYGTAWEGARALGLHAGAPPAGALVFFRATPGNSAGHVGIALPGNKMISAESNGVHVTSLAVPYWSAIYAGWTWPPTRWPGRAPTGAGPTLEPSPAPSAPPSAPPTPSSPPASISPGLPTDRHAITSYNRMSPGAPHYNYFDSAWQPFVAQSNTITLLGVTVGNPRETPGAVAQHVTIRLCSAQPTMGSCPGQLLETSPRIENYGATLADIGDVGVNVGQTYWVEWYQPPSVQGTTWVTYWWAGGSTITTSDQMQLLVQGYTS